MIKARQTQQENVDITVHELSGSYTIRYKITIEQLQTN